MANLPKIRAALIARLKTSGDLIGVVGARIYGEDVPGNSGFPYVRVSLASGGAGTGERDLESGEVITRPAFEIAVVGRSEGGFDDLHTSLGYIDAVIDSWRVLPGDPLAVTYGGVFYVEREGEIEGIDDLGGDTYEYTLGGVYRVNYCPAGA